MPFHNPSSLSVRTTLRSTVTMPTLLELKEENTQIADRNIMNAEERVESAAFMQGPCTTRVIQGLAEVKVFT